MTIPTTIGTGGHAHDSELTDMQKAVLALLGAYSSSLLSVGSGGTGLGTYAAGDLIYASAASTLARLAKQTNGQLLQLASGLPAWAGDTSWTAVAGGIGFANSWVDFGAPWATIAYFKDASGFVHLRGTMKSGTIGATAFTLPSGYRPSAQIQFPAVSNGAFAYFRVDSAGVSTPIIGNNAAFDLSGITFDTR